MSKTFNSFGVFCERCMKEIDEEMTKPEVTR